MRLGYVKAGARFEAQKGLQRACEIRTEYI
jgi:hypothetical protein